MTDKNKFPMPMIKSPEYAAEKIFNGLTKKNTFEIHFPITFTIIMKLLKIMPNWLYFSIGCSLVYRLLDQFRERR
jgi:hypothetical protein